MHQCGKEGDYCVNMFTCTVPGEKKRTKTGKKRSSLSLYKYYSIQPVAASPTGLNEYNQGVYISKCMCVCDGVFLVFISPVLLAPSC